MLRIGIILTGFGMLYLMKPTIFMKGIWKERAITQHLFTPQQYSVYMRILGAIFIVAGIALILVSRT
jgi:hypothetical protein